jgi:hypothetical protein
MNKTSSSFAFSASVRRLRGEPAFIAATTGAGRVSRARAARTMRMFCRNTCKMSGSGSASEYAADSGGVSDASLSRARCSIAARASSASAAAAAAAARAASARAYARSAVSC